MNIYIGFKKVNKNSLIQKELKGTIYNFSREYKEKNNNIEILSSRELSEKEIKSLGKIYFNDRKILEKGYIDLIIDKYIVNFIE